MSPRRVNLNFGSLRMNRTLFVSPLSQKKETEIKPKKLLVRCVCSLCLVLNVSQCSDDGDDAIERIAVTSSQSHFYLANALIGWKH